MSTVILFLAMLFSPPPTPLCSVSVSTREWRIELRTPATIYASADARAFVEYTSPTRRIRTDGGLISPMSSLAIIPNGKEWGSVLVRADAPVTVYMCVGGATPHVLHLPVI